MTHGSLFSGIGGFDLAAEWMGWKNIFHCEWNPFGQKVLKYHFPNSISYEDITKTDFTIHRGRIDILTGGFPCQPYSMAGKRLGKEDERHLWPEMLRAIREIQPRWVVGENVFGLINWSGGLVFHEVQADLEAEGYEVQPYVLPAVSVNAPHRRDRVWFVAYSNRNGRGCICGQQPKQPSQAYAKYCDTCRKGVTTYTKYKGFQRQCREWQRRTEYRNNEGILIGSEDKLNATNTECKGLEGMRKQERGYSELYRGQSWIQNWQNFPTQSPICSRNDGLSTQLDGITFSKWRNESIKAGGNAIVPQVVHQIFKAIEQYEKA